ncbi:MAG TPA: hypothetical protein VHX12_07475 [Acidisoma sp.]|nr:hypothetical protein [Acidisoma sp.]
MPGWQPELSVLNGVTATRKVEMNNVDWLKPSALAAAMTEAGTKKADLPAKTIIVTGILSGMFLGFTTTL